MHHFIDRRANPKGKSLGNRQRFLRRARDMKCDLIVLGAHDHGLTHTFLGTVAASDQDQYYNLTLNVYGDGTTLLDSQEIVVVVPGTSY